MPFICCGGNASEKSSSIRIMSFNIWHDGKAGKLPLKQTAKVIQMGKADIVGLQEVKKNAEAIADMLGWHYIQQGSDTAILSRFEILGTTKKKFGVKIRTDAGNIIYVFNVHLMHAPYQPYQLLNIPYCNAPFLKTEKEAIAAAKKARGREIKDLLREIESISDQSCPVFITGDFNEPSHLDWTQAAAKAGIHPLKVAYPSSEALAKAGFLDAYRTVFPDEIKKSGFTWTPQTKPEDPKDHHDRIDFVLAKGQGITPAKAEIVGENTKNADIAVSPFPSDHRAVIATFNITDH